MRYLLCVLFTLVPGFFPLRAADDSAKLIELGSYFEFKDGSFKILLSHHWLVWKKGVRQFFYVGAEHEVMMKPGDILVVGDGNSDPLDSADASGFYRYQLDKLTPERAFLTVWRAPAVREQLSSKSWKIRPGEFVWKEKVEANLPAEFFDDSEVNGLELSASKSLRTK